VRVLQLCTRIPFPPIDGGSIAMYNSEIALLSNGAELKVLAFNTIKQFVDIDKLNSDYKSITSIETVFLNNNINSFDAFSNLFSSESYHVVRFITKDFEDLLIATLTNQEFDIIQLESLFMIPYVDIIRKYTNAKVVLRTHNIEYLIWKRMAGNCYNPIKKWYLNLLALRLKKFEIAALNKVDAITALTSEDKKALVLLGAKKPIFISPIGIKVEDYVPQITANNQVIFHIGAMDWLPNQEGISWFLNNVWPEIKVRFPKAKLRLAGKKMPISFLKFNDQRCEINEYILDASQFMNESEIMVVPLFSGSGMRVKIIEGMALGKAIVTTSIGAEGIPAENGKHLLIANDKLAFVDAIALLLNDHEKVIELGQNAIKFAQTTFDNHHIGNELIKFYQSLLSYK